MSQSRPPAAPPGRHPQLHMASDASPASTADVQKQAYAALVKAVAADANDGAAQCELGEALIMGRGCTRDIAAGAIFKFIVCSNSRQQLIPSAISRQSLGNLSALSRSFLLRGIGQSQARQGHVQFRVRSCQGPASRPEGCCSWRRPRPAVGRSRPPIRTLCARRHRRGGNGEREPRRGRRSASLPARMHARFARSSLVAWQPVTARREQITARRRQSGRALCGA